MNEQTRARKDRRQISYRRNRFINLKHRLPLIAVAITSVLCITISIFLLKFGQFTIFQNLFYIPIIISCFYYKKQGFAISVSLSCIYFFLIIAFTSDPMIIRDAVIRVLIFIIIATVITALSIASSQAEEALRESEEKYRLLVENANEAVCVLQDGIFRYANRMCGEMLGVPVAELIGVSMLKFLNPDDRETAINQHLRILRVEPAAGRTDFRILTRHGEERWVDVNSVEIVWNGKTATLNFATDITDRKLAEEALRAEVAKAELEAQNRQLQKAESLNLMAGAIAHTFNNQLGVVIGNLELAMMELSQGTSPHAKITAAMKASNRAAEVSGLMLTYLGQSFDKLEPLDLSDACRRGLPMLRAAMPRNVVLETDLPSPGPVISANENEIQQVLTNLITNACEAVGEGRGAIHLNIKTVSPSEIPASHRFPIGWQPQDHAYACMEAADAGCGIEDKDIEKLFDPFFTSKFTGRGLGLPVVLGIVKAHGGAVTVESEPNRGSTFRVFLPISGEEVPRQPDKVGNNGNCGDTLQQGVPTIPSPAETEGSGTVLLVEDEEMVRDMAAAMLKRLGFSVVEAKDGVEAVDVFRKHKDKIRCVLCDNTMPRMNGWETLTALRKLAPDIPVILASGYDEAQVMAGDHAEWPQIFLGKPYKLKGLSDAIGQVWVNKKK